MEFHVWLAFASASIALLLIPGPTVLLVLSYAISQGKRVAVATAAGVALGDLVAMSASLAGLGGLVLASAELFLLLKTKNAVTELWALSYTLKLKLNLVLWLKKLQVY